MDDEVIFADPFRIRLLERGAGGRRVFSRQRAGQLLDFRRADPAAGRLDEILPGDLEGQFELDGQDAVIEILDASLRALAGLERRRVNYLFERRALEADVIRRGVFETRLANGGLDADDGAQRIE